MEEVVAVIGHQATLVDWAALAINSVIAAAAATAAYFAWRVPYQVRRLNAEDAQALRREQREATLIVLERELELLYQEASNGHFQADRIWNRIHPELKGESIITDEENETLFRITMPSVKVLDSPEMWSLLVTSEQARKLTDAYSAVTDFRAAHNAYFDSTGRVLSDKVAFELVRKLDLIRGAVDIASRAITPKT